MKKIYGVLLFAVVLAGCKEAAPKVDDVDNIVVNGKQYAAVDYYREFCSSPDAKSDENCIKVEKKVLADQTKVIHVTPQY